MKPLAALIFCAVSAFGQITWLGQSTGFAYFGFTGSGQPGPNIFTTAYSTDGTTWTALKGEWTDYITKPASGTYEPFQINAPDCIPISGTIYCHVTVANDDNLHLVPWILATANPATGLLTTVLSVDWTSQISGVNSCFAGGFARNSDMTVYTGDGNVHLYIPCTTSASLNTYKVYETHAAPGNLLSWSNPVDTQLDDGDIIDPEVYFIGSTFYMWCKNENTSLIQLASGSSATGTFSLIRTGNWAGWGGGVEGPFMYRPPNGIGWILMFEAFQTTHLMYYSTCNTDDPTACTWTAKALWTEDRVYRHGAVVPLG
jgi:hypothetical protein